MSATKGITPGEKLAMATHIGGVEYSLYGVTVVTMLVRYHGYISHGYKSPLSDVEFQGAGGGI